MHEKAVARYRLNYAVGLTRVCRNRRRKDGVNSALGIAPTTPDFVQEAAISDMFEIQSSKIASGKLSGPEKEFADQMVADHSKTTDELTGQAKADNISVPCHGYFASKDVGQAE